MTIHNFVALMMTIIIVAEVRVACGQAVWTPSISLPSALHGAAAVPSGTSLYVLGGFTTGYNLSSTVLEVTTDDVQWTPATVLPQPFAGSGASVAYQDAIIVAYGAVAVGTGRPVNASVAISIYNTTTRTWAQLPNASFPRKGGIAVVRDDALLLLGGMNNSGAPVLATEVLDLKNGVWANASLLPVSSPSACDCSATVGGGFINLLGCHVCGDSLIPRRDMLQVNVTSGEWRIFGSDTASLRQSNPFAPYEVVMGSVTVAEYTIAVAPQLFGQPTVLFFNMALQQLAAAELQFSTIEERNDAALVASGPTVFVIGGRSVLSGGAVSNVDTFTLLRMPTVTYRVNRTYVVGESVLMETTLQSTGSMIRLSPTSTCSRGPLADARVNVTTSSATIVATTVGSYYLCVTFGSCEVAEKQLRQPCGSGGGTSLTSCVGLGCCWDDAAKLCYQHVAAATIDALFWVQLLPVVIEVVPPPPPPPPTTAVPLTETSAVTTAAPAPTETPTPVTTLHPSPSPSATATPQPSPPPSPQPSPHPSPTPGPGESSAPTSPPTALIAGVAVGATLGIVVLAAGLWWMCVARRRFADSRGGSNGHGTDTKQALLFHQEQLRAQATTRKYRVVGKLGKGAHGTVYLVVRNADGRQFALKYIACETDAELRTALKEFEVIRGVQGHPNMITLVDMFMNWSEQVEPLRRHSALASDSGSVVLNGGEGIVEEEPRYVCIVMEYFPDGDLRQWIVRHPEPLIPALAVVRVAEQVFSLLEYLHGLRPQIVHRDVKPENILSADGGSRVVVTDFGLAFNAERTHMTTRAGSLYAAAPEAWTGHYTAAIDVWGGGVLIYVMCTRRATPTNARVMFSDARDPGFAAEVRHEMRHYPPALCDLMLETLAIDADRRPTAAQAHRRLQALLRELEGGGSPSTPD